jgi:glutathione-regulated potassium-efflux system ancillary protein KefC
MSFLHLALVLLAAAVIVVPIFRKLGLGSVLGYLVAGVALGPWGFQLIKDVDAILHFSELGVVFLLFLIGLELEPKKLWSLRVPILGMGSAQLLGSAFLIALLMWFFGYAPAMALVAGLGFALSSTAIALQLLEEKNLLSTRSGSSAFSILLFQDLAVIPMLALLPLLGKEVLVASGQAQAPAPWLALLLLLAVAILGRFLLRPALRLVASVEAREVFTAFALLLVIGMAALMTKLGLSMALGAFLAGVLLADSE